MINAKRILVAYATGSGSTAEVAEAIGEELADHHTLVDVMPAAEITQLETYHAVVLGSSIRVGSWLPEAVRFLDDYQEALAERKVAFFTTCLTMAQDTHESHQLVLSYMEPVLQRAPEVQPVGLGLFAGSLNPDLRLVMPGGPYGDFRDWEAIRRWAREIRSALLQTPTSSGKPWQLSEVVLSFTDLSGSDFRKANLRRAELRRTQFKQARLNHADLTESDLTDAGLQQADLEDASLGWADLKDSDLREAKLSRANLIGANLRLADLRAADLQQAILNGVDFTQANLQGANLRGADLNWARLEAADLRNVNLAQANLGWADLSKADLREADLTEARYNNQTQWPEGFSPEIAGCIYVPGGY